MKKNYFLILLLLFAAGYSQTINIPDPVFKAALVNANPVDGYTATGSNGEYITVDVNGDGEIQQTEALLVYELYLVDAITDLTGIKSFTNLTSLECSYLELASLDVSDMVNLQNLNCSDNYITQLNVSGCTALYTLHCDFNELTTLDLNGLPSIHQVLCGNNSLSTLDVSGIATLEFLSAPLNGLQTIDLDGCTNLSFLQLAFNELTSLDLSGCHPDEADIQENYITNLNIKNGFDDSNGYIDFYNNPLQYLCIDEAELQTYQTQLTLNGMDNCSINSYCSFTPGGTYYTIGGINRIDSESDGCESTDPYFPSLKFSITANTGNGGTMVSNLTGAYQLAVPAGEYIIAPILENPSYFNISPANVSASFPAQASPFVQDFCITPNGTHADLEVSILPLTPAIPGFDADYKIVYRNKGNQVQSGTVSLNFQDTLLELINSVPPTAQTGNLLSWSFVNLLPTESRSINLRLNVNAPTDNPAVNIGDELSFSANVSGGPSDETIDDNTYVFADTVVGSFDPNDKTCLEGDIVSTDIVGDFVHYLIRFENTGTFAARNIVVKDMIDESKFDMSSFTPTAGSHQYVTRVTNGNVVEFIFENINLPFDDANNDGYVSFMIRTKSGLVAGDSFSNTASIYFDFNLPIVTNTATTTIQLLGVSDFDFSEYIAIYPNPAPSTLNLSVKAGITVTSMEVYNMLGQRVISVPQTGISPSIDVSPLRSGNYFLKVFSDKGTSVTKFLKQ